MRKTKPKVKKVKAKAKPKKKVKPRVKKLRITDRGIPVTKLGNFDDDSDWRLKAVHHNINQAKRAIYDLSINVEGEHDHISKTIARCHDRIEHVEGLVTQLSGQISDMVEVINKYVEKLNEFPEKYDKSVMTRMTKEDAEERVRAALENLDGNDDDGR